jgi:hypothetical protein
MKKIISLKFIPKKTIITLYALRWVFFFIFLFLIAGIISVFLIDRIYTQMILTYSITGFFTFFTGYFGWIFARGVINTLSKNEDKLKNGNKLKKAISYHISEIDE